MLIKSQESNSKFITFLIALSNSKVFFIIAFALLTSIAAQIAIPTRPVPFTLQTMIVLLSGAFLGAKNGAYSQFLYLLLGILGLPVFAQVPDAPVGFARIIGPTGGYLLAFPAASFLVGYLIEKKKNYCFVVFSMLLAEILILSIGVMHLAAFYTKNLLEAVKVGAAVFSVWMIVKVFISASVYYGFSFLRKNNS